MEHPVNTLSRQTNTKTLHFVLLAIFTFGIYNVMWLYRNTPKIEELTQQKIMPDSGIFAIAILLGLNGALSNGGKSLEFFALILLVVANILYIVWSFSAKKALEAYAIRNFKMDLRLNSFYTFFLTIFYINFSINSLEENYQRKLALEGSANTTPLQP